MITNLIHLILMNRIPIIYHLSLILLKTLNIVSGGFATVNADSSMNINAVEACLLEQVDQAVIKSSFFCINVK